MAYKIENALLQQKEQWGPHLRSVPMVAFRKRVVQGQPVDKRVYEAEFATMADAEAFVEKHRAIAATKVNPETKEVTVIPGKYERLGAWDWFNQYVEWRKVETTHPLVESAEKLEAAANAS